MWDEFDSDLSKDNVQDTEAEDFDERMEESSDVDDVDSDVGALEEADDAYLEEDAAPIDESIPEQSEMDDDSAFLAEDTLDSGDQEEGPVLRHDPDEFAAIMANTLLQRADVLRDDLRDKGWEDGPEMEEYVNSQMSQWKTEAAKTYIGEADSDATLEEDNASDPADSEGSADTSPESILTEDSPSDTMGTLGEDTSDSGILEEDSLDDASSYPSGYDYSKVDWDQVYKDIEAEQDEDVLQEDGMETELSDTSLSNPNPETDTIWDNSDSSETIDDGSGIDKVDVSDSDSSVSSDEYDDTSATDNKDVQNISDVSGWLGEINPNFDEFDPESPYCNNCGSCAYAVYQRLEGSTDSCASADNIGYNSEMNALTGMEQVSMSPQEIEQRLLNQGDGAHAIIGIDRAEGPGHWFNAACLNGRVVAIDGQTGEITDWPPDYGDVVNWEMSVKKEA